MPPGGTLGRPRGLQWHLELLLLPLPNWWWPHGDSHKSPAAVDCQSLPTCNCVVVPVRLIERKSSIYSIGEQRGGSICPSHIFASFEENPLPLFSGKESLELLAIIPHGLVREHQGLHEAFQPLWVLRKRRVISLPVTQVCRRERPCWNGCKGAWPLGPSSRDFGSGASLTNVP